MKTKVTWRSRCPPIIIPTCTVGGGTFPRSTVVCKRWPPFSGLFPQEQVALSYEEARSNSCKFSATPSNRACCHMETQYSTHTLRSRFRDDPSKYENRRCGEAIQEEHFCGQHKQPTAGKHRAREKQEKQVQTPSGVVRTFSMVQEAATLGLWFSTKDCLSRPTQGTRPVFVLEVRMKGRL